MSKNKLNLTLSPDSTISATPSKTEQITNQTASEPMNSVDDLFNQLKISDIARERCAAFQSQKEKIGEIKEHDIEELGELGSENKCVVMKVRHISTQLIMACKQLHLELKPAIREQIIRELEILHKFNFPHIIGFYHIAQGDGPSPISICMEYMDGGSIDVILKRTGRINEKIVGKVTLAVLKALIYLKEKHNMLHRNIQPSNILVNSNGEIKVCDFGASGRLIDSMTNSYVGTKSYTAPERLQGMPISEKSDIWSLGLSLIEMALGIFPIPSPDSRAIDQILSNRSVPEQKPIAIFELLDHIVSEPSPKLRHPSFDTKFSDFTESCLSKEASQRPDLNTLLKHPWIAKSESDCTDVAEWVCRVMNLPPSTPT